MCVCVYILFVLRHPKTAGADWRKQTQGGDAGSSIENRVL